MMAAISLAKCLLGPLLSTFLVASVSASPVVGPRTQNEDNALHGRAAMDVKMTTTSNSRMIDWIPRDSQGEIASPPPAILLDRRADGNTSAPLAELQIPGAQLGPPGTVPIPRISLDYQGRVPSKSPPPLRTSTAKSKRQYYGSHWYVSSNIGVNNRGGSARYSMFSPYVDDYCFSLLQTAVSHDIQTVEAGWFKWPTNDAAPYLFTYFNTNGYASEGDYIGGYNQDHLGWVQYDDQIFPGTTFSTISQRGGVQYDMRIEYQLFEGNWWLSVEDRWIGYYPGSLFNALGSGADGIFYYGEIAQLQEPLTATDMGSGEWPSTGYGHSAYIRQMTYLDENVSSHEYTAGFWESDVNRYAHSNAAPGGSDWGSYIYLGGPGAGGVIGA
ncbi:DUF239-domain-containing protein [Thozetella sp. PMI_491]|nr:DUF239-domain-containing protein [Thozetella sp. PMI_491]